MSWMCSSFLERLYRIEIIFSLNIQYIFVIKDLRAWSFSVGRVLFVCLLSNLVLSLIFYFEIIVDS